MLPEVSRQLHRALERSRGRLIRARRGTAERSGWDGARSLEGVTVLVDEARWPAHGRLWAHLVSDESYAELHAFAGAAGLPPRGFDHDHYDVPAERIDALVEAGAQRTGSRELLRRLVAAGLRVSARERAGLPSHPAPRGVVGIVLAAGAGTRSGGPGALALAEDGSPRLHGCVTTLRESGCQQVLVVLGADADRARELVPAGAQTVVADRWREGMSASLRAGLEAAARLEQAPAAALVVLLADPDVGAARLVELTALVDGGPGPSGVDVLARATVGGRPSHPVLIGRARWAAAAASASGERAAGHFLRAAGATLVPTGDDLP